MPYLSGRPEATLHGRCGTGHYAERMDFATAVRTCLSKYATFEGRAGRAEFWWFMVFTWLVSALASTIDGAIGFGFNAVWWGQDAKFELFNTLAQLLFLLPTLAVATRRLRDAGKSFYNFFWLLLPVIGWIVLIVNFSAESDSTSNPDNFAI